MSTSWIIFILIFITFMVIKLLKTPQKKKADVSYQALPYLLTAAERSFYAALSLAVDGRLAIFAKVRVADLITPQKGLTKSDWQGAFNKISAKHVDFVLCDLNDLSVVCVLELNDKSHQKAKRKARDAFLQEACQSAGLPLVAVAARSTYQVQALRTLLADYLPQVIEQKPTINKTAATQEPLQKNNLQ